MPKEMIWERKKMMSAYGAGNLGEGKVVVTVLPDSGQRYFSTDLYIMEEAKLFLRESHNAILGSFFGV
ncbi:MAG: hypothetical protein OEX76_00835 [Candidatus Bathyarchaeota archaeon]|nr:hypothetical protein [Candidatus Bathyarchaeota archaeon]